MKKMTIVALAAMLSASMAFAGMGINWSNGGWMYASDGETGGAENNAVLWQLIYAGENNEIDDVDLSASDYVGGDDALLASRLIPQGGGDAGDDTSWDEWVQNVSGTPGYTDEGWSGTGLYVYQRLFEGETPAAGMYYFESDLLAYSDWPGGSTPLDSFYYDAEMNGVAFDKQLPETPEIPEPATMSLLGLGALAMVIRRKLRK